MNPSSELRTLALFSDPFAPNTARQEGHKADPTLQRTATLRFDDNTLLKRLVGEHDHHLIKLEEGLGVRLSCRGNKIALTGENALVQSAVDTISILYEQLASGTDVDAAHIDGVIRLSLSKLSHSPSILRSEPYAQQQELPKIKTKRGEVVPRSLGQAAYIRMLQEKELTLGIGPAGTGKTYLAVAQGLSLLQSGNVDRIVLSRPAVEAGERLGFLPGDMREKIDPYLRPLYDALHDMLPGEQVERRIASGEIEVAPLAFMRGRTLAHAYVILDEAQNTTPAQMKMFLTRMGQGTKMVVNGDLSQIDLPYGVTSGLWDACEKLENVQGIGIHQFTSNDVVRHPLVARIVNAYAQTERSDEFKVKGQLRKKHAPPR